MPEPPLPEADAPAGARPATIWSLGLAGGLLCYLAHPPVGWSLLAWIGPAPWVLLARLPLRPGKRAYLAIWGAGIAFWLVTIQWLRLPHPGNHAAWALISIYLGAYLPVFVAVTRRAYLGWHVPLWIAAPVVWTGLELVRAHLLSGFLMASLAHTQASFPAILQIASLAGEYGVTFLIMLVAASIASAIAIGGDARDASTRGRGPTASLLPLLPAAIALAGALLFGVRQLHSPPGSSQVSRSVRIGLVQSDMLSDWKGDAHRDRVVMEQQVQLSRRAVEQAREEKLDLIVWPETMFRLPLITLDRSFGPDAELPETAVFQRSRWRLAELARDSDACFLVGVDRVNILPEQLPGNPQQHVIEHYNSAAFVSADGELLETYDKMHLLPFGEYIPLVDWLPLIGSFTPITGSASAGDGPRAFRAKRDGVVYAPNICYETVLPHLIRQHVVELTKAGARPDVLVNLTNDAWYWGSAELDMHLASGVLRAVEMQTPLVIAANRGLSASIDHAGRVVAATKRDVSDVLATEVRVASRTGPRPRLPTLYAERGDWLPASCLAACALLLLADWRRSRAAAES